MRNQFLFSTLLAAALSVSAASASTVSLHYDGPTSNGVAKILSAPVTPVAGFKVKYGAFGFKMTDTTGALGSFVAWCLDVTHALATKGTEQYAATKTPFSNSYGISTAALGRIQSLFDANYRTLDVTDRTSAASFQSALWETLYDTDHNTMTGAFRVSGADTLRANGYLDAAMAYTGPSRYRLTFLESTGDITRQNLVTVSAVPLPAGGMLLVSAIAGFGALRRRRKAA